MATYSLEEVMGGKKTYSLNEVMGKPEVPALSRTDRVLQGMRDPIDAGAQLLTNALPSGVVNAGNRLNNFIADKTGLVGRIPEGGVNQMISDNERQYQAGRPEGGFDAYRLLGNIASPANLALASKLPQAASLAGRVGTGIVGGAGLTAATVPVVGAENGGFWKEKGQQALVGGVTGGAVPLVTGAASRIISPNASKNANVNLLRNEGVNPTIGQTLGGRFNSFEEKMQSLPIVGDMISNARGKANSQFQGAAFNRALKPIGLEIPKGLDGREALVFTENALKTQYDDVLNRIGSITPDEQFNSKLSNLESMVNSKMMPKAEKQKFFAAVQDIRDTAQGGAITSEAFKELESSLGSQAQKLGASQNIYEGKLSPAVKQLQQELRDMLQRQAGPQAQELKAVNSGWANFKRVQNASAKIGAEDGAFTPAQFQNAVRALDKSKDKGAFARGSALGQDLGDAGKTVLGSKVPNSGTAERLLYGGGALATGAINPAIPASLLGGAALYTQPAQKALTSLVAKRPQGSAELAEFIRQNGNYILPGAGALGLGFFQ